MSHEEALGFAHILLIVLVFALEIPVLVVEASADDRIRHLLHKRLTHRAINALMIATLVIVITLIFVGGAPETLSPSVKGDSNPTASPMRSQVVASARVTAPVTAVTRRGKSAAPTNSRLLPVQARVANGGLCCSASGYVRMVKRFLSGLSAGAVARAVSATMLVFFGVLWLYMMKSDIRSRLVREISRALIRSFERKSSFKDQDVEDLITLGENSSAGHEKLIVLNAVADVCETVQLTAGYDGNELADLIHGLDRIIAIHEGRPTDGNVLRAIRVLGSCWARFEAGVFRQDPDREAVIETACSIGEMAVKAFPDSVARACLDAVPKVKSVPFRIGIAALQCDRFFVAVAALTRLRALTEGGGPSMELVALFAHFCAKGNSALATVRKIHGHWSREELAGAIDNATGYYYQRCDFVTADVIIQYGQLVTEWNTEPGPAKSPRRRLPKTQYRP